MSRIAGFVLAVLLAASGAWAQDWRGEGRLSGKVVDQQGKALPNVIVRATLPAVMGAQAEAKTDKRGDWSIEGLAEGNWQLKFFLDGYDPAEGTSDVDETGRSASVKTTLKKSFDPNAFIKEQIKKGDDLMAQNKYAEARAVYEAIVAKVPEVTGGMQQYISRAYYAEGNMPKAIEHLKLGIEKDPSNPMLKIMLGNVLVSAGNFDEAAQVLSAVDESKATDPELFLSLGLAQMKQNKNADAVKTLDKGIARFPQASEAYYYRASANIALLNAEKDEAKKKEMLPSIKADLNKFLELTPNAPEANQVKKILEQISK